MTIKRVISGDTVLAKLIPSEEWSEGLGFYTDDEDFIQVGTWKYNCGKKMYPHIHNKVGRIVEWTQELIYVRKGKLLAKIYDEDANFLEEFEVNEGDMLILLRGGHGFTALKDGTEVLEIKSGPYPGHEIDKIRI